MELMNIERRVAKQAMSMATLHSHAHYEIYILTKGSRSFLLTNRLYKLEAPAMVVIPPHVLHMTEGGPYERYNVYAFPDYLNDFEREVLESCALVVAKPDQKTTEKLTGLLEEMEAIDRKKKHADTIEKALFCHLVLYLKQATDKAVSPAALTADGVPPVVLKIIDFLNANYAEKHTLDSLAKTFFVSKTTLIYNFKKYINHSPIDFLLNVRLTRAKELLLTTNKSIGEIAELCGFSSSNYFGLIFKSKEGLSPSDYRKYRDSYA